LSAEAYKRFASELGLDEAAFGECFDSGRTREEVLADMRHAESLGVTATPTFFINGRFLSGAQPFERFREIIDEELAQ
jgi:predicted DsbA family dithiol-disulfide isomerase